MTPNFITGLALSTPSSITGPVALWIDDYPAQDFVSGGQQADYASICTGACQQAQGYVTCRHTDGRVTIDAGGRILTGHPVTPRPAAPRGFWERLSQRLI